ncbi:MAG: hypothetical protein KDD04_08140, partial [Sinomicrobium sp.]|nr:hypothetical protein [Sinomicrobium sp.]
MNTGKKLHLLSNIVLTASLWLTGCAPAFPQDYLFDTEIINVEDGLPHRMVYNIVQDKEGFIWISTQGAISRYDGYNFKTYNASFLNIAENNAVRMAIDAANRLWYCEGNFGTLGGGIIDTAKDSIYSMETVSKGLFASKDVVFLGNAMPNSNDILIVTRAGVIYNYNGADFEEIYRLPDPVSIHLVMSKANPDGSYWVVHGENLFLVKKKKTVKTVNTGMLIHRIISSYPDLVLLAYSPSLTTRYWRLKNDSLTPFTIAPHAPQDIKGILQLNNHYNCYATNDTLFVRD